MLNLKKTALAVLAFGSSAAFAGTMGPVCTPGNVTVPCESTAWNIGIQALYLKPSYTGGLDWVGASSNSSASYLTLVDNDPDWAWGFKLEGSYHFSTGNDLNLNWYHLGSKTTSTRLVNEFDFPLFDVIFRSNELYSLSPRWDAVNLEFGQHSDFGEFKNIRFHAGVQYARIKTETWRAGFDQITEDGVLDPLQTHRIATTSTFNGFGPRAGLDMSYDWGNGLAMYGNAAGALLIGTSKFSNYFTSNFGPLSHYTSGSRTTLVPELEGKLGLTYSWPMAQGDLTLDGGYMWVNYFDAQMFTPFPAAVPTESNFAVNGPFLGLKWVGTVV